MTDIEYEPIIPALPKVHGMLQIVMCVWVEGHGWLTSRRAITSRRVDLPLEEALIEVKGGVRAMQAVLAKEGIELQ